MDRVTTNPTPSPGLSSKEAPSQAALAAAPRTMLALNKRLLVSLGLSTESAHLVGDRLAELEKGLAAATQLAETNAKALADERELLEIAKSSIELLKGQLSQSQQALARAEAELAKANAELGPLRALVGVDPRAASGLHDIAHWIIMQEKADAARSLENTLAETRLQLKRALADLAESERILADEALRAAKLGEELAGEANQLAQSQAREASLAAALRHVKSSIDIEHLTAVWQERVNLSGDAVRDAASALSSVDAALGRHQAAVGASAVEESR